MIQINLIPDVKRELLKARATRNLVMSISVFVGIVAIGAVVVWSIVLGGQVATEAIQDNSIKSKNGQLQAVTDLNETVTIQNQLAKINEQAGTKQFDSRIFDVLSSINPSGQNAVSFSNVKLNPEDKTISLEGSAPGGYGALEALKKTMLNTKVFTQTDGTTTENPLASEITTGDTSFGESVDNRKVLRFGLTFTYPETLFGASSTPVRIVGPNGKTDVTDSKLGVPESLFNKQASDMKEGN